MSAMLAVIASVLLYGIKDPRGLADEIVAKSDALSVAMSVSGRAEVDVTTTRYHKKAGTSTKRYSLMFDGSRLGWNTQGERGFADGKVYAFCMNYDASVSPPDHFLRIQPFRFSPILKMHPANLAEGVQLLKPVSVRQRTVAELIRAARQSQSLDVEVDGDGADSITVSLFQDAKGQRWRSDVFTLSRTAGCVVTSQRRFNRSAPDVAYLVSQSDLFDQPSTPWPVRRTVDKYKYYDESIRAYLDDYQIEWQVLDIQQADLADVFSVSGLELPKGARIEDQTTGKTYLYGIPAINEKDLNQQITQLILDHQAATAPKYSFPWLWFAVGGGAFVAVLVLLVVAGYLRRKRMAAA